MEVEPWNENTDHLTMMLIIQILYFLCFLDKTVSHESLQFWILMGCFLTVLTL